MDTTSLIALFSKISGAAGISFWDWDVPSGLLSFQDLQASFDFGESRTAITINEWESFVIPEDREEAMAAIAECTEGGADSYVATARMRLADGKVIWIQDRGWVAERDPDGKPLRIMGLMQDMTHAKTMEQRLREKRVQLDLVADISGLVPWEWNRVEQKVFAGRQFSRMFGYSEEEIRATIEQDWFSVVHPDDRPRVQQALDAYLAGDAETYREEVRMRRADGEYLWVITSGIVSEWKSGVPFRIVGGLFDIDAMKKNQEALTTALKENRIFSARLKRDMAVAEENLRTSKGDIFRQRRLLSVVNGVATDLLFSKPEDIKETILRSLKTVGESANADRVYIMRNVEKNNELCIRILHGWSDENSLGERWSEDTLFRYADFEGWEDRLRRGEYINAHVHTLPEKHRQFFEALKVQSILVLPVYLGEEFWGVIYFGDSLKVRLSDEPELKTLQSSGLLMVLALMRSEAAMGLVRAMKTAQAATRAKSLLLANTSHEMKTPLNAILGMTDIAEMQPEKTRDCLAKINGAARHLLGVINEMLDMANLVSGEFHLVAGEFNLPDLLRGVHAANVEAALGKKQDLTMDDTGISRQRFLGDAARLKQVLDNLVSNAVKFTPEGGAIRIEAREEAKAAGQSELRIRVRDNGIGIDNRALESLFIPFEQVEKKLARSFEGAGLGLSIAQGIARAMGGKITVRSEPGRGSVFTVYVPLRHAAAAPPDTGPDAGSDAGSENSAGLFLGKNILVAEDNEINREIVISMLEETGAVLHCAENGRIALDMVRENPDMDLVLMDIHMPEMDGFEAARNIRALPSSIPIIAVTANDFPEDAERCEQAGMDGHVGKPIDFPLLFRLMRRCLNG